MDCKYESKIKAVSGNAENIYARLSNFSSLGSAMPSGIVNDWQATETECKFTIDKIGRVGLQIEDRTPNSMIKYGHDGTLPFDLNLWVQIKQVSEGESRLKVTLRADLNPMIKLVAGSKMQELVDKMADSMSRQIY